MEQKRRSMRKDEKGFTGLEAAIVLTAFIVVAAVFSYVVLNAGFFTTEKAKEVVHTGVTTATSAVTLAGDVIGVEGTYTGNISVVYLPLKLAAGGGSVDIGTNDSSNLTISYIDAAKYENRCNWTLTWLERRNINEIEDDILDYGEKVQINVAIPSGSLINNTVGNTTDKMFTLDVKPVEGAVLSVNRRTPSYIEGYNVLY